MSLVLHGEKHPQVRIYDLDGNILQTFDFPEPHKRTTRYRLEYIQQNVGRRGELFWHRRGFRFETTLHYDYIDKSLYEKVELIYSYQLNPDCSRIEFIPHIDYPEIHFDVRLHKDFNLQYFHDKCLGYAGDVSFQATKTISQIPILPSKTNTIWSSEASIGTPSPTFEMVFGLRFIKHRKYAILYGELSRGEVYLKVIGPPPTNLELNSNILSNTAQAKRLERGVLDLTGLSDLDYCQALIYGRAIGGTMDFARPLLLQGD